MRIVEIFLPLAFPDGARVPEIVFAQLKRELVEKFGGVTAYSRAPAEGVWASGDHTFRDAIVIFEVMASELDRKWWGNMRERLELTLRQEKIVIRSTRATKL
jgi:hypothetical protein